MNSTFGFLMEKGFMELQFFESSILNINELIVKCTKIGIQIFIKGVKNITLSMKQQIGKLVFTSNIHLLNQILKLLFNS